MYFLTYIMEVVTGKLVNSSSERQVYARRRLSRWTKLLFLFHLVFFVHHASRVGYHSMMELVITFFVCGMWIPFWGLTGAYRNNKSTLMMFSIVEYCLSLVTLYNILTSTIFLTSLNDGCASCASIFDKGNEKCQYGRGHNKQWLNISQSDCEHFPSLAEIGFNTFLTTSIVISGCSAAFTARQIARYKQVIAVVTSSSEQVVSVCPDVVPCSV